MLSREIQAPCCKTFPPILAGKGSPEPLHLGLMWELKMLWLFLGLLRLSAGSGEVAGPGACPLYDLSVPEGSSGHLEINITEKLPVLCKMQSAVAATDGSSCTPLMVLANKEAPGYFNSTFEGRMNLTTHGVTVKKAEKWLAGQYRVDTSLHETCLARINLTVPELPAARDEMVNLTGEGSSNGTLTNSSAAREPRSRYGLWASLVLLLLLLLYLMYTRNVGGAGAETQRCCEEEGSLNPAGVMEQEPNGEAPKDIPLNDEATKP
ncbi:uncharacterized protein LOC142823285 isoform X2 [Pelodiscus sinensis]|uniref:uncharacterized protein LOC142823285 isoform X2 n=1 Tax=Pelodiscus sinensis TaxID=13735 RepID=UPI003F6B22EB